jgi:hypothetical protein
MSDESDEVVEPEFSGEHCCGGCPYVGSDCSKHHVRLERSDVHRDWKAKFPYFRCEACIEEVG